MPTIGSLVISDQYDDAPWGEIIGETETHWHVKGEAGYMYFAKAYCRETTMRELSERF